MIKDQKMGSVKNLQDGDAVKKLRSLAEGIHVCMFCTQSDKNLPFETRPMATQEVDDEGNIWFLSGEESHKNTEIWKSNKVQLIYSDPSGAHFLVVYGQASILRDRRLVDEMWNETVKAWFRRGKDAPDITLIKVRPEETYYWDMKYGAMVSLMRFAASAFTGRKPDDGVEGELIVK